MNELEIFKKCLRDEGQAILDTIDSFSVEVLEAVKIIQNTPGHVIVTGVGKSGHIGEKIAASLASTGTPAFFMHATEAVHGDLGMVTKNDCVILISNSGETAEVLNILPTLNNIGVKKISITRNHNSTLAKNCDVSLAYNYHEEADHLHLAPTTSSIITLAIGDALAVTLSKLKNFTADDFYLYHPGGSLGKMLERKKK
jgi:arabinose-5-phosphate isomerase